MKNNRIVNGLLAVLSIFVIIGVFTFAHVCESMGGEVSACHKTRGVAVVLAIALTVISIVLFFDLKKEIHYILSAVSSILAFLIVLLPDVIAPVCKMHSMHCYVYTRPFLILVGSFLTALALYGLMAAIWKGREEKEGRKGHEAIL